MDRSPSVFCDNVPGALFGVSPREGPVRISPLIPDDWEHACADDIRCRGRNICIAYTREDGYSVAVDGKTAFTAPSPQACTIEL